MSVDNVINLAFSKCCECGNRATKHIDMIDENGVPVGQKHFCSDHGKVLDLYELCSLLDERDKEIADLRQEIARLKIIPEAGRPESMVVSPD